MRIAAFTVSVLALGLGACDALKLRTETVEDAEYAACQDAPDDIHCELVVARYCADNPGDTTRCTGTRIARSDGGTPSIESRACTAELPVYLASEQTCVQCTANDRTACVGASPVCDLETHACVACLESTDCPAQSPVCSDDHSCGPCAGDADCSDHPGAQLCIEGRCAECTRSRRELCDRGSKAYVCDPTTHRCDDTRTLHSLAMCGACISNDECQLGDACVDIAAGGGTKVCQRVRTEGVCPRPYLAVSTGPVPSADGDAVRVCTLQQLTTCKAHADYRTQRCGTPLKSDAAMDTPGTADDSRCGIPGLSDGYCVWAEALSQYLCTVPCGNNVVDCPDGAIRCDAAPTPDLCAF
jgi:hypothetical protein